ncbi:MAG: peptidylprolyl isomerase [Vicinamibacterales bacterium]
MSHRLRVGIACLGTLVAAHGLVTLRAQPTPAPIRVLVETDAGAITLEIDLAHAPVTGGNFLKYVDGRFYDGGRFHRTVTMDNQPTNTVKIEVIQGAASADREKEYFPAIALERTSVTGLTHTDGALSMARDGPDTARDEFFICIGPQPSLDFGGARNPDGQGFAVFGRVVSGMDVVRKIQASPVEAQKLTPAIKIVRMRRM